VTAGVDIQEENSKLYERVLKVFLHLPPPLERENLMRIVDTRVSKIVVLSIQKSECENYLFHSATKIRNC
jgi:hypothetical protein